MQKLTVLLELYQEHELSAHMSKEIYQLIKKKILLKWNLFALFFEKKI